MSSQRIHNHTFDALAIEETLWTLELEWEVLRNDSLSRKGRCKHNHLEVEV